MADPVRRILPSVTAATPFRFYTSFVLQEATGLRAATLPQLAGLLRTVPEACVYHHTHYFLLSHHYLSPEPTNDFAYWVAEMLGEGRLGEVLASIDTLHFRSLADLRTSLADAIDHYLAQAPLAKLKFVSEGEEFHFIKSVHVVAPTPWTVTTLAEFAEILQRVSVSSLYFHVFDAHLRVGPGTNDFSKWLREALGEESLAADLEAMDPYTDSLEMLRTRLVQLVRQRLEALRG